VLKTGSNIGLLVPQNKNTENEPESMLIFRPKAKNSHSCRPVEKYYLFCNQRYYIIWKQ